MGFAGEHRVSEIRSDRSPGEAVLLAKGGRFYIYEPDLAVIASGDSVEAAYRHFGDARQEYLGELERAGVSIGGPVVPLRRDVRRELTVFCAKLCIVLVVIAAVGVPAILGVGRSIDGLATALSGAVDSMGSLSLGDLAQKAAAIAKDAQSLPDDKKEQLRQSIGIISREASPLLDAWRNPPKLQSAPPQ